MPLVMLANDMNTTKMWKICDTQRFLDIVLRYLLET